VIPLYDSQRTTTKPILTVALILVNLIVYLMQIGGGDALDEHRRVFRYAAVPYNLTHSGDDRAVMVIERDQFNRADIGFTTEKDFAAKDAAGAQVTPVRRAGMIEFKVTDREVVRQAIPAWLTLLFAMFMHGSWMHLIGNMWFLWIFGNNLEDAMGRVMFFLFYVLTGFAAHGAHIASGPSSVIPCLGASGAISGVLGGYLLLYPRATVTTLVPLGGFSRAMPIPAPVFLLIWFGMQFLNLGASKGGVAWWAHIGGFVAGFAIVKLFESAEHKSFASRVGLTDFNPFTKPDERFSTDGRHKGSDTFRRNDDQWRR
jgi:membrane associated rhomboid family serine protease